ncbi:MAG TPA: shikimate dehydrogenase [Armatimonadota bacterium]|nr:shikimate dehydrogenase [Armatimonadota bacterium]
MKRFAFIMHPLDASDVARKYRFARWLPDRLVEFVMARTGPKYISEITGIRSATGAETQGWFVGCPLTSRQFVTWNERRKVSSIVETAQLAQSLGADIVGLGAFTAIVGNGGIDVAREVDIAVTTGNSYTVATAVEGATRAAALMDMDLPSATAVVLGATGSIGRVCAHLLMDQVGRLILVARGRERLEQIAAELGSSAQVEVSTDIAEAVPRADVVIAVTSSLETIVEPEMLRPGAVVCDVARPRDVSVRVARERDDVLVIEGGAVAVPGDVQFHFNFGFPPGLAYACMAETMILALEERIENYSLGKDLELARVQEIARLADKHGFGLAGFRSFERAVDEQTIARIRDRAQARRSAAD